MDFAKYYDVTETVKKLHKNGLLDMYTPECGFISVYVCEDSNDFWVARVQKGYNVDYEQGESKYLMECNKISIIDVAQKLHETRKTKTPLISATDSRHSARNKIKNYINSHFDIEIITAVLQLDNDDGLSNWDCEDYDSIEELKEDLDGGFGIVEFAG